MTRSQTLFRIIFLGLSLSLSTLQSAVITVNSLGDVSGTDGNCTCREAIENANANSSIWSDCAAGSGTDTINLPAGTITLQSGSSTLAITDNVVIVGQGVSSTRLDGAGGARPDRSLSVVSGSPISLSLQDLTLQNSVGGAGGTIYFNSGYGGLLTLQDVDVYQGNATNGSFGGGAIYAGSSGGISITNARFVSNTAAGTGGAILVEGTPGQVSITASVFEGNSATNGGGAMLLGHSAGSVLVERSLFYGNSAAYGGAIFAYGSNVLLRNDTFHLNQATTNEGGALRLDGGVTGVSVDHCTFNGNMATAGSGALYAVNSSSGTVQRSILWSNGIPAVGASAGGSWTSLGENVSENGLSLLGSDSAGDPGLGALSNNGGFTRTLSIGLAGSAYEKVSITTGAVALDQRGIARPQGTYSDAGAFELVPPATPTATATPTPSPTVTPGCVADLVFDFNNSAAGFSGVYGASITVGAGYLTINVNSPDPVIERQSLAIAASDYRYIRLTIRNNTAETSGKLYYATVAENFYSEAKSFPLAISALDASFKTYIIDTQGAGLWAGTLTALRFDPIENSGGASNGQTLYISELRLECGSAAHTPSVTPSATPSLTPTPSATPSSTLTAVPTPCVGVPSISAHTGNGSPSSTGDGGAANAATLTNPFGLVGDSLGGVYIADNGANRVRYVDSLGNITTVAGTGTAGDIGIGGQALAAQLNNPHAVAIHEASNSLYILNYSGNVRRVDLGSGIITTYAGQNSGGFGGDGSAATSAFMSGPAGMAVDGAGNLYIADSLNHRIRRVDFGSGNISTFAGNGTGTYAGDGLSATAASLNGPRGVAVGPDGSVYIADANNHRIRKVSPGGIISTVAGNGNPAFSGDGGLASAAEVNAPQHLAFDAYGNLYLSDNSNYRIRRIDLGGYISTVAGTGAASSTGNGGPASAATLNAPMGVAILADGSMIVAEYSGSRTRRITCPSAIAPTATPTATVTPTPSQTAAPACAATPIAAGVPVAGDTTGQGDEFSPVCGVPGAADDLFYFVLAAPATVQIDTCTGTSYDSLIELLSDCGTPISMDCNDDSCGLYSSLTQSLPAGVYYIVVDGASAVDEGAYTLSLSIIPPTATPSATPSATLTATPSPSATPTVTPTSCTPVLGDMTYTTSDTLTSNWVYYSQYTLTQTARLDAIRVAIESATGSAEMAVYSNAGGVPGIKLDQSGSFSVAGDGITPTAQLSGLIFSPGIYWLAILPSCGGCDFQNDSATGDTRYEMVGAFPGTAASSAYAPYRFTWEVIQCGPLPTMTVTPTQSPSGTASATPSGTATATPSATATGTPSATATLTPTASATPSATPTATASATASASPSTTPTASPSATASATASASATATPSGTETGTPSETPSVTPSFTDTPTGTATPTASPTRTVTATFTPCGVGVLAGTGTAGNSGNGGLAVLAQVSGPKAAAYDSSGALYIADTSNNQLRMVDPVVGNISAVSVSASVGIPEDVLVDGAGVIYIADVNQHRVLRRATDGTVTVVAGTGFSGNVGLTFTALATSIPLNQPTGLALDSAGNLYIADQFNHAIRKVDAQGLMSTVAGTGTAGYDGEGAATAKQLWLPKKLAVGLNGTIYIAENNRLRTVSQGVMATLDTPTNIMSLALDGGQNLFVGLGGGSPQVRRYAFGSATGTAAVALGSFMNVPDSLNVGPQGTLAVAHGMANRVRGAVACGVGVVPRGALPVCVLSQLQAFQSARGGGKNAFAPPGSAIITGPNPARVGGSVCASVGGTAQRITVQLYDLHGRMLAARTEQGSDRACVDAPASLGIYFVRTEAQLMDGSKIAKTQKLGVKP